MKEELYITEKELVEILDEISRDAEGYIYTALQEMKEGKILSAKLDFAFARIGITHGIEYVEEFLRLSPDDPDFNEYLNDLKIISKEIDKYLEKLQPTETH